MDKLSYIIENNKLKINYNENNELQNICDIILNTTGNDNGVLKYLVPLFKKMKKIPQNGGKKLLVKKISTMNEKSAVKIKKPSMTAKKLPIKSSKKTSTTAKKKSTKPTKKQSTPVKKSTNKNKNNAKKQGVK